MEEPNELFQWSSHGGTRTLIQTYNWVYIGDKWNLAPAAYPQVDQYRVNKHIDFDIPFCSPPTVWLRDRQCISMNGSSPNDGFPFANITNLTATGFDVEYYIYYVKYDMLGRAINRWIPSTVGGTKIEYTAVGIPNLPHTSGNVSGADLVCSSTKTCSLDYVPENSIINWTHSSNLTYAGGQGTNAYKIKWKNSSTYGNGWVKATITNTNGCGSVTRTKNVWVGKFTGGLSFSGGPGVCNNSTVTYTVNVPFGHKSNYTYLWSYPSGWTKLSSFDNKITLRPPSSSSGGGVLNVTVNNGCGTASGGLTIYSYPCGGYYMVYPNPTSNYLNVGLSETENSSTSDLLMNDLHDSTVKVKKDAVKYQIIDKEGVVYEKGTFELPIELDLSGLPSGNYMLIIEGKEIQEYKHFIKE